MEAQISPRQLKRLQTLWGLFWKQIEGRESTVGLAVVLISERSARLAWVGGEIGRQVLSCKDLSRAEAEKAIDALQKHLPAEVIQKRRLGRRDACELGMAGRRGYRPKVVQQPDAQQLERIARLIGELGWEQARFEAWLRSRSGPLRGRSQVRTKGDANAVAWGLKRILAREKGRSAPAA